MRRKRVLPKRARKCFFCEQGKVPDFVEFEVLRNFVSERGKIIPKLRTGTCSAHQRQLTKAVKRARFLALLPFTVKI